ncbi:cob(I)yrinic acid a,c-diamide adenosyltransferase [Pelosinus sp. IPA-1]|uniref:cob(I)yrinic acid a,c-diamide adenosyltransferase n=1 Tax=Pelosinus sp. IPA-1 TaxID=3029569 RepID=UPI0024362ACE|nr:cob(I)yrinic acid a,c-diamide adenosyltransferase [Pelosinus sp. IPA-1]GMA97625.1 ATP--cobalamin adenosyltransferase [Pelosinus sp. IPA-1]
MMKVYTKTGDEGQTSLLSKQRVFKDHARVDAYGTVDEANAAMGLGKSLITNLPWAVETIQHIQVELISLNADLATENLAVADYRITQDHVTRLESIIDSLEQKRIPQHYFVTPGTCSASAALDLARTMVRRAERCVVRLKRTEKVTPPVSLYLNRLSDVLFVLARCVEQEELIAEVKNKVLLALKGEQTNCTGEEQGNVLNKAKKMIALAEQKAMDIGVPMVIAVVDVGGNLVAQHRMDGALLASVSLALDKAYTAVALKMPTHEVAPLVTPGNPLFGLHTANGGRFIAFGGGFPIIVNGNIVGGLGVSGGAVDEDMIVAKAGLAIG